MEIAVICVICLMILLSCLILPALKIFWTELSEVKWIRSYLTSVWQCPQSARALIVSSPPCDEVPEHFIDLTPGNAQKTWRMYIAREKCTQVQKENQQKAILQK